MGNFQLLAGLGNPGSEYETTRHNIGFRVLEALFESNQSAGKQPAWKVKGESCLSPLWIGNEKIWGVKPQSFMNRSGRPLREVLSFYKIQAENLLVVHDEVDLPLGKLQLRKGGGDAGHNGVKSVVAELGTKDFYRLRIGVGKPQSISEGESERRQEGGMSSWVLGHFSGEESSLVEEVIERALEAIEILFREGLKKSQNRVHG